MKILPIHLFIMRSTPLFLGNTLYHLRYDLNSVADTEHLITGGFNSILSREITPELCTYLLWSGLKWGHPHLTIQDTEKLIVSEIGYFCTLRTYIKSKLGIKEVPVLLNIATACINELFLSGWYNKPKEGDQDAGKSQTIPEIIESMVKGAEYCGYTGDPYKLTPSEINFFIAVYNERLEHQRVESNFRMAMICAAIFNSKRTKESDKVWYPEDFMPRLTKPEPMTADQMKQVIVTLNAMFGGEVK